MILPVNILRKISKHALQRLKRKHGYEDINAIHLHSFDICSYWTKDLLITTNHGFSP